MPGGKKSFVSASPVKKPPAVATGWAFSLWPPEPAASSGRADGVGSNLIQIWQSRWEGAGRGNRVRRLMASASQTSSKMARIRVAA